MLEDPMQGVYMKTAVGRSITVFRCLSHVEASKKASELREGRIPPKSLAICTAAGAKAHHPMHGTCTSTPAGSEPGELPHNIPLSQIDTSRHWHIARCQAMQ